MPKLYPNDMQLSMIAGSQADEPEGISMGAVHVQGSEGSNFLQCM